jgi:hypothetical protein
MRFTTQYGPTTRSSLNTRKIPGNSTDFCHINDSDNSTRTLWQSRATFVSQSYPVAQASPFDPKTISSAPAAPKKKRTRKTIIPRKAAVQMTPKARKFFTLLLENPPADKIGVMLHYDQSNTGEPRMVFSFDFCSAADLGPDDEGVSLRVLADGITPVPPVDSLTDGLPKLYVSGNAFLKVLGATVDVDIETMTPLLVDREGNPMDPND